MLKSLLPRHFQILTRLDYLTSEHKEPGDIPTDEEAENPEPKSPMYSLSLQTTRPVENGIVNTQSIINMFCSHGGEYLSLIQNEQEKLVNSLNPTLAAVIHKHRKEGQNLSQVVSDDGFPSTLKEAKSYFKNEALTLLKD